MTSTTAITAPTTKATTSPGTLVKGAGIGTGLTVVANVVVFLLGNLGAPLRVKTGWNPDGADLQIGEVIGASVTWVIIGAVGLWVFERVRANGFGIWVVAAATVSVVSILPVLRLDFDTGTKAALSAMHLVVGASAIAGQALARRGAR